MRRLLLSFFLLASSTAFAQEVHRLTGYIQMANAPLVSYFVQYTVSGTKVSGYTITDYKEGNRLRASLIGVLSPASELYIEENGSLDEPGATLQAYCYFKAHLKLTVFNGRQRWSGTFESSQKNGTPCGGGTMTMLDEAPPPPPPADIPKPKPAPPRPVPVVVMPVAPPKKDTVKPVPKDTLRAIPKKLPPPPKPVIIINTPKAVPVQSPPAAPDSNGCMRTYDWNTDALAFDIWDGWTIDGDVVSVSVGGQKLLDHAKLSELKQHFSIPLARGTNTIIISLHEEGFDPPNTPNMTLYDGTKTYDLGISGAAGETVRICINRNR